MDYRLRDESDLCVKPYTEEPTRSESAVGAVGAAAIRDIGAAKSEYLFIYNIITSIVLK